MNDKQYETLLVDVSLPGVYVLRQSLMQTQFDSKPIGPYESDSDDVDESLTVPGPPGQDVRGA